MKNWQVDTNVIAREDLINRNGVVIIPKGTVGVLIFIGYTTVDIKFPDQFLNNLSFNDFEKCFSFVS